MCLEEGGISRTEQSALMAGVGLPARTGAVDTAEMGDERRRQKGISGPTWRYVLQYVF
jgi:hypothetical protein